MNSPIELICYPTSETPPAIIPAPMERDWMDRTSGFAYRCLPLNIANGHGWLILNDAPFFATWHGGDSLDAVKIARGSDNKKTLLGSSHFGFGVLTFSIHCLFRTSPGYDLWITGPVNMLKDGIQPLSAVVETDWSPATFTMNWRFTREYTRVWFDEREPICMIFPVKREAIESVSPKIRPLESEPSLASAYDVWYKNRLEFNRNLLIPDSLEQKRMWQKNYFIGKFENWRIRSGQRRTKNRAKPFDRS